MFKPMLAPNETVDLATIQYPILASYKLDGIRGLFLNGSLVSRALKYIPNKQIQQRFAGIVSYCQANNIVLDGEFYSPTMTFQEITSCVMTDDFTDPKTVKKNAGIYKHPDHFKFYVFDCPYQGNLNEPFSARLERAEKICGIFPDELQHVQHEQFASVETIEKYFEKALTADCEGLILRNPTGYYKCGRGTLKEGLIYKMKPYTTFDAQITNVVQATKVDPTAEKKTNELGRSVTSKKLGDRIAIDKAAGFEVMYTNKKSKTEHKLTVVIAATDPEKADIWTNRDSYINRWIEYKGMLIGSKDVPRHPVMVRFRDDKN